jgi:hypothetical protein
MVDWSVGDNSVNRHHSSSNNSKLDVNENNTVHLYDQSTTTESRFRREDPALEAEKESHLAHH